MSSEQSKKRNLNRYHLLRTLQAVGPLRRRELGETCGIRLSSITSLVDELLTAGILENQVADRPRSPLTFTRERWFVASACVTATELRFALVGLDGQVSQSRRIELCEVSYPELYAALCSGLADLQSDSPGRVLGLGVALPGIVDSLEGIWHYAAKLPQIHRVSLCDELSAHFGLPVHVENDVRCSLWAGIWFEQLLAKYRNAIYLSVTFGVHSALLINGELHSGASFSAGEIGHLKAGEENRPCQCGATDCLESYCSIPALACEISRLAPELGPLADATELAMAAQRSETAAAVLDGAMERISRVLSPLVAYVDPQVILLGNQASEFYEAVLPSLRRHLGATHMEGRKKAKVPIEIVVSESPVLRGVAGLVLNEIFKGDMGFISLPAPRCRA
jgi:predicted NBD/HSP70 family sugar kinase